MAASQRRGLNNAVAPLNAYMAYCEAKRTHAHTSRTLSPGWFGVDGATTAHAKMHSRKQVFPLPSRSMLSYS